MVPLVSRADASIQIWISDESLLEDGESTVYRWRVAAVHDESIIHADTNTKFTPKKKLNSTENFLNFFSFLENVNFSV